MYLNDLQSKSQPSLNGFGGINTGVSPFNIGDSEASDMLNLSAENYPAISVAKGDRKIWQIVNSNDEEVKKEIKYTGMLFDGIPFFIGSVAEEKGIYCLNGTNEDLTASWISISGSSELIGDGDEFTSTSFGGDQTVITTGGNLITIKKDKGEYKCEKIEKTDDAMPSSPDFVVSKDDRVILASRENSELAVSELLKIEYKNPIDYYFIQANTISGENTTAISIYSDMVMWFKRNATIVLNGKSPSSYSWDIMTQKLGCINGKTIAETNSALMWLGADGVYAYSATTLPYKISMPVQKYIDNMSDDACGVSDGIKYYLSLKQKDGSYVLLIYNTEFKTWHVRQNEGYKQFVIQTRNENDTDEIYLVPKLIGHNGEDFFEVGTGEAYSEWYFVTKPFDVGGVARGQNLRRIYFNIRAKKGASFNVSLSGKADGEGFVKIKSKMYIADTDEKIKIDVPVDKRIRNMPYFRVKIAGSGDVSVYGMELHQRILPKTY